MLLTPSFNRSNLRFVKRFFQKKTRLKINFYLASGLLTHPQFDDGSIEVVETVMLRFTVYEDLNIHCKTEFLQQSSGWIL